MPYMEHMGLYKPTASISISLSSFFRHFVSFHPEKNLHPQFFGATAPCGVKFTRDPVVFLLNFRGFFKDASIKGTCPRIPWSSSSTVITEPDHRAKYGLPSDSFSRFFVCKKNSGGSMLVRIDHFYICKDNVVLGYRFIMIH